MTTSHPKQQQSQGPETNLPDGLDWECTFNVHKGLNNQVSLAKEEDWTRALKDGRNNIMKMLTSPGILYHDSLSGFHVAYSFNFSLDDEGNIVADGTCYAAHITERDFLTYYDQVLAQAAITITPRSNSTREALEAYIRTHSDQ